MTYFINGVAQKSALRQMQFTEKVHYAQYCLRTLLTEWPREVHYVKCSLLKKCIMPNTVYGLY